MRSDDKVLENHLKTCGKNRSYISKNSQDKIFTIIASEAADSSHKEQMALVLQFVDKIWILERSSLLSSSASGD